MYVPSHFANENLDELHLLIRQNALGTLVTEVGGVLEGTHVPCILDPKKTPRGTLRFHLAAGNPTCGAMETGREVLMIFIGPQSYISPDWYETKELVPTWNYAAVHAYGQPSALTDSELCNLLDDLNEVNESLLTKTPWTTKMLPRALYRTMRAAIRGYQIPISRIEGKWKMSQNRSAADRTSVIDNLKKLDDASKQTLADVMETREKTP